MSFSKRFKELREGKGLSQEELSKKLNIPRTSVTHYESNDERMPKQQRLNEIADFFGVSVDYLVGRTNKKELNKEEKSFLSDIENTENPLSIDDLINKYTLTVDDKLATKDEIEGAIAFIRSLRSMK